MANLIFAQYVADAIIYDIDGAAYHYIGTTASAPNADVGDIGEINIPEYTFNTGDPQSKTVYTKCENAVAFYLPANYTSLLVSTTNETDLYTAPSDGVVRVWTNEGVGYNIYIYVNGTQVYGGPGLYSSKALALGLNLNSGDVLSIKFQRTGNTAYSGFLPDTY